jgi:outer membrane protein TolC
VQGKYDVREIVFQRINAERQLWQQQGELSRVTSERLLEASETYIDLLSARNGEAIATSQEKDLRDLLKRAEDRATAEQAARVEVQRIQAEISSRQQALHKVRQQAAGASAKLAYLLGIDPCTFLVPVDAQLVPLDLVDASGPTCDLVARALANGPGVRELEGLLNLVQRSIQQAHSRANLLPTFEVCMGEGIFGAGPGASSTWDNRFDVCLSARWNLTEFVTRHDKLRILDTKAQQAHLAYQDLRGKLTAGVQEAREAIVQGKEQIRLGQEQIDRAREAYNLANNRLREGLQGSSVSEVMLSLQSVARAQLDYLAAVREYDRAQLRLLVLLGPAAAAGCQNGH